ncbi:LAETG motif-containing sortase-dependent surface protein [Streptantibioticus parmotrematis]|uniref:LAETG motif-containing sortase-dependent surface protein n=1 Tax=Streptantibioticus parmotrematis TaxID=2873249 RepID=UPI0033C18A3A
MATRRSLTTTTAVAGGLLAALCFVPSASASVEHPEHSATASAASAGTTASTRSSGTAAATRHTADTVKGAAAATAAGLADTGSVDTTPYLVGGSAFLGVGAALLLYSRRRALVLF